MKSLQTIQKTIGVFQVLTKIAMILSFVWAGLALLGMLFGVVWYCGGNVVGADRGMLYTMTNTGKLTEMIGVLLADSIFALTDGVLLAFVLRYFKAEQSDGTPFTFHGAGQVKRLGIRAIVLPIVTSILAAIVTAIFDIPQGSIGDWSSLPGIIAGVGLILFSLILRYGAELEEKNSSVAQTPFIKC